MEVVKEMKSQTLGKLLTCAMYSPADERDRETKKQKLWV